MMRYKNQYLDIRYFSTIAQDYLMHICTASADLDIQPYLSVKTSQLLNCDWLHLKILSDYKLQGVHDTNLCTFVHKLDRRDALYTWFSVNFKSPSFVWQRIQMLFLVAPDLVIWCKYVMLGRPDP